MSEGFDEDLLTRLVCPMIRTRLRYDPETLELVSDEAGLAYPMHNGIPVMLIEEARRLDGEPAQQ